jgi:opacity protein-like surface antigen
MRINRVRMSVILTIVLLFGASAAYAQGFVSPLLGYDFGGDSGCAEATSCEDKRLNFGVAFGSMGHILGFEEEIADARNFFGEAGDQKSSVVTAMSNLMIVPAIGRVHPYVLIGLGLMKTHVEFTRADLANTDHAGVAWDIGGGVTVLFARHIGVRGDIRHMHSAKAFSFPFVGTTPSTEQQLTFGRAAAALVFAF